MPMRVVLVYSKLRVFSRRLHFVPERFVFGSESFSAESCERVFQARASYTACAMEAPRGSPMRFDSMRFIT